MAEQITLTKFKSLCRSYTAANVSALGAWANSPEVEPSVRMQAIQILLDRGWGKPAQSVTGEGGEGPVVVEIINPLPKSGE